MGRRYTHTLTHITYMQTKCIKIRQLFLYASATSKLSSTFHLRVHIYQTWNSIVLPPMRRLAYCAPAFKIIAMTKFSTFRTMNKYALVCQLTYNYILNIIENASQNRNECVCAKSELNLMNKICERHIDTDVVQLPLAKH